MIQKIFTFFLAIFILFTLINAAFAVSVSLNVTEQTGGGSAPSAPPSEPAPPAEPTPPAEEVPPAEETPPAEEVPPAELPPAELPAEQPPSELPSAPPTAPPPSAPPTAEISAPGGPSAPSAPTSFGREIIETVLTPVTNIASTTVALIKDTIQTITTAVEQIIPEPVKEAIEITQKAIQKVRDNPQVQKTMSEPAVQISTDAVSAVTAGTAATVAVTSMMPLATSLADFASLPIRVLSLIFGIFLKKRRRWGVVYDSITKQPLDPVYVVLKDKNGKEIDTKITDMNGRFGFLIPAGEYYIEANKTHYKFPSEKILGASDELYDHLYHGEILKIDDPDALIMNIPMDAEGIDWNEMIKQQDRYIKFNYRWELVKRWFPAVSFIIGFVVTGAVWILHPTAFNQAMLWAFVVLWILRQFGLREKIWGLILDKATKKPLPFAMLKIFFEKMAQQVHSATTDLHGRYYALVEPGKYDVLVNEKKTTDGYQPLKKETSVDAKHGVLNRDIFVDKNI